MDVTLDTGDFVWHNAPGAETLPEGANTIEFKFALNDGSGHFTRAAGVYPSTEIHLCYDSDEDGRLDLTMTYQDGGGQWWRNRSKPGELLFEPTGITRGTNTARRQAMIDINRDGRVDWLRGTDTDIEFDFGDGKGGFAKGSSRSRNRRCRSSCPCRCSRK